MADNDNPLAQFLAVPGATTTLPVSAAKDGFAADFVADARQYFNNFHDQMAIFFQVPGKTIVMII